MIRTVAGRDGWWVILEESLLEQRYGPYRTRSDAAAQVARLAVALQLADIGEW
jgi:hypothetical protein